jgi:transcriptional regulator with XRE-family HTH domain
MPTTDPTAPRRRAPTANQEVAVLIRTLRTQAGLTQEAFAYLLNRKRSAVTNWETGRGISLTSLVDLARQWPGFLGELVELLHYYSGR